MVKSSERKTEYYVVIRPRHREQAPICYKGYAKNEEEAVSVVFNPDFHKEVLDVKTSDDIEWNHNTVKEYWKQYGEPAEKIEIDVQLF